MIAYGCHAIPKGSLRKEEDVSSFDLGTVWQQKGQLLSTESRPACAKWDDLSITHCQSCITKMTLFSLWLKLDCDEHAIMVRMVVKCYKQA